MVPVMLEVNRQFFNNSAIVQSITGIGLLSLDDLLACDRYARGVSLLYEVRWFSANRGAEGVATDKHPCINYQDQC